MRSIRVLAVLAMLALNVSVLAQEAIEGGDEQATEEEEALTLERLFPEKGLFGPRASGMTMSHDGRYGAYLWRPYPEKRHGSDLWIYDFESGESRRITMVSVMRDFQESARKVSEDRIEKAKKKQKAEKQKTETEEGDGEGDEDENADVEEEDDEDDNEVKGDEEEGEGDEDSGDTEDDIDLGDMVDDKDADDEEAPRYGGVRSIQWSPTSHTLLMLSGGDIYQYDVAEDEIQRLTRTKEPERGVQYLPDGSGYTYMRGNSLICIEYGSHTIKQLDPKLPDGETMQSYNLSPDGTRLVMMTRKGQGGRGGGEKVTIVNYRDRFAKANQVNRQVPSSKYPDIEWGIYLYDLSKHMTEEGALKKVHSHKNSGPRDSFMVTRSAPQWSPDSSKVAFSVFNQETSLVEILEAGFEDEEEDEADEVEETGDEADDAEDEEGESSDKAKESDNEADEDDEGEDFEISEAKVIYKFFHHGGPNTPSMIQPYYLADNRRLAFVTEQSGFRHVHVLDPLYETLDPLTRGRFEVYPQDISEDHSTMIVRSNREGISVSNYYALDLETGDMTRLTSGDGVYSGGSISDDGTHLLATYVDFGELRELRAIDLTRDENPETILTDSHPEKVKPLTEPIPEYFSFKNRHGHTIHGHMFKPDDWTADDKRPLMIYVYGGPLGSNRNMLARGSYSASSYLFAYYMAKEHGYVTCTIDPRGVSGYGAKFEKANFEQVGKPQVEDIVDAGKWMIANQGVDADRIGMHGWSFGGFQTQMCLYTEPDFFACGIAGAGPTEWFNYNSWYTTGT
ncbi:MAG: prolyl oligopeptidase family serine peptidase, partial [Planctomycetota bacterium]|nr:prolyl oligopeptidase family serine peptidase [Planctomycetota bacterium]